MDYDSDEGRRFGGINRWHHLECFVKLRQDLGFLDLASSLSGFLSLKEVDRTNLKNLLPRMTTTTVYVYFWLIHIFFYYILYNCLFVFVKCC